MSGLLRVALAQIDTTVGDIEGNTAKIRAGIARARDEGAMLVVFPELALTGYPPEDLLLKTHFLDAAGDALEQLASEVEGIVAMVGFPERADDVYNAAAVLADGRVAAVYRKVFLPNYSVFDEQRYFQSGPGGALLELNGIPLGITICEDIWEPGPPATDEALAGAQVIVNLSASPYHAGKGLERETMLAQRARDNNTAVLFCNLVGGPGRAGVRRPQRRDRPGRRDHRSRRPVRGGDGGLHDRSGRDLRQAPPGRAPPGGRPARRRW